MVSMLTRVELLINTQLLIECTKTECNEKRSCRKSKPTKSVSNVNSI